VGLRVALTGRGRRTNRLTAHREGSRTGRDARAEERERVRRSGSVCGGAGACAEDRDDGPVRRLRPGPEPLGTVRENGRRMATARSPSPQGKSSSLSRPVPSRRHPSTRRSAPASTPSRAPPARTLENSRDHHKDGPPERATAGASATNRALSPKMVRSARRVPTGGPFLRLQNPPPPGPRAGRHQHQPVAPHYLVSRVRTSVPVEAGPGGAAHRPRRLAQLRCRETSRSAPCLANGRAALASSGSLPRPPAASTNPTP
jgi:hypothetical protein